MAVATTAERVDTALREREARGLRVPAIGRIVVTLLVMPLVIGNVSEIGDGGMILTSLLTTGVVWLGLSAYTLFLLIKGRHVSVAGSLGSLMDAAFVCSQLGLGVVILPRLGLPPILMMKSSLPLFAVMLVAINGLALRPRYPLLVGGISLAAMGVTLGVALFDPSTVMSTVPKDYLAGPAVAANEIATVFMLVAFATAAITFITHFARVTIRKTIEQELDQAEAAREHMETVMRQKMDALAKLVAGVSHELNSPLGVIKSGLDTQAKALRRLEPGLSAKEAKLLDMACGIASTVNDAVDRIDATATSLRSFAHLDEADVRPVNLREQLSLLLDRAPVPEGKRIDVTRTFEDVPEVVANAKELMLALGTILENAFDAIAEEGTVEVRLATTDTEVTIAVADSGCGLAPDVLEGLFDVGLRPGAKRVAARFGLPAAQSIAHRHGGRVSVKSELGEGSTFTLHLPLDAEARAQPPNPKSQH